VTALARMEDLGDRLIVVNANVTRRNALSPEYYGVLGDALALAAREPRITSVLLRGEGGFFCAGGDLGMLAERRTQPRAVRLAAIESLHDVVRAIVACPKPVIAVVDGGAAGAGVSIAFACDLIVAGEEASFTVAYVRAGLVPDGGLTRTLLERLPAAFAARMALLGEPVPARRLHALGAINEIADAGGAFASATRLADALARGPAATQTSIKRLLRAAAGPLEAQLDRERDAMADAVASAEAAEGIGAFLGKRAPDFAKCRGDA